MYLIIGLGNPGKQYGSTRHNIGFRFIDRLSKDLGVDVSKGMCRALIGQGNVGGHKIILAKPQTFMNLSGDSVRELVQWFKIEHSHVIVAYDDLDLEIGQLRIKPKGNAGGHHGVESVISCLGATEFIRIRIGIGRGSVGGDNSDYVLSLIPANELEAIDQAIVAAAEAVPVIVEHGLDAAMNKYNPL